MTADMLELIQRDLDGDLSPEEKLALEKHLQADPELQLVYARLRRVSAQLEQLPDVAPPFSIVDSILPKLETPNPVPVVAAAQSELPKLERRVTAAQEQPRTKTRRFPLWAAKAGSGVAAACLLFGLFMLTKGGEPAGIVDQTPSSQPKSVTVQTVDDPASGNAGSPDKTEPPQKESVDSASQGTTQQNQPAGGGENSASSPITSPNPPAKGNNGSPGQAHSKGVPAQTDKEKEKTEKEREKEEKEKEKEAKEKEKEKAEKKENNNDNSALIDKKLHEKEEWQKKQEEKEREEEEKQMDRGK
ncbi:anti-sigma factor family protein [Brevibacillus massiliensis]|jgi:hypothetical protein|uniref:anti-sigma factor family protein n=1 Tax=Brevibacillus massiliensis TaxID=1118054 RepID=UPI000318CFA7|nr:zf-HC2 domain-containing protein [Brevibacillus massiliensis]